MATIAHLTDLHLLEDRHWLRDRWARARLSYLSFGRELDPSLRRQRFSRALAMARVAGPDHLLITGDLTEDGVDAQFEVLDELLAESRIPAEQITLVPGNHDAYVDQAAWGRALAGPLRRYAPTSTPGTIVRLPDAVLLPISTAMHQYWTRSAGHISERDLRRIAE